MRSLGVGFFCSRRPPVDIDGERPPSATTAPTRAANFTMAHDSPRRTGTRPFGNRCAACARVGTHGTIRRHRQPPRPAAAARPARVRFRRPQQRRQVARDAKLRWQQVMADYLAFRHALAGIVLLVDARHGFTALDEQLLRFVAPRVGIGEVRLLVLLTKADKLGRAEAARALAQAQRVLGASAGLATEHADIGVALFSALTRQGVDDAAITLRAWRDALVRAPAAAAAR